MRVSALSSFNRNNVFPPIICYGSENIINTPALPSDAFKTAQHSTLYFTSSPRPLCLFLVCFIALMEIELTALIHYLLIIVHDAQ